MADLNSLVDTISNSQVDKTIAVNELFNAASPSMMGGRRRVNTGNLSFSIYGGVAYIAGLRVSIPNGAVSLVSNNTNYIYYNHLTNSFVVNQMGFVPGFIPLYTASTGNGFVNNYIDHRQSIELNDLLIIESLGENKILDVYESMVSNIFVPIVTLNNAQIQIPAVNNLITIKNGSATNSIVVTNVTNNLTLAPNTKTTFLSRSNGALLIF